MILQALLMTLHLIYSLQLCIISYRVRMRVCDFPIYLMSSNSVIKPRVAVLGSQEMHTYVIR